MHFINFFVLAKKSHDFFVDISSFLVISGNFAQWRHHVIWRHSTRNQELLLRNWCIFLRSLVVIEPFSTYLWLPTYIPFYHIFFWPAVGQLIPCWFWSPIFKLLLLSNHSSVSYKWPLFRKLWCCSLCIFMF